MKNLKTTKAKLPENEKVIGRGVPSKELNEEKTKKLGALKAKTKTTKNTKKKC